MRSICFAFLLVVLFTACDSNRVFESNLTIENSVWKQQKPVSFEVEVTDTLSQHNMYLNVRNSGDYPYQNLIVFVDHTAPSGKNQRDTIECDLAFPNGKWRGSGVGSVHSLSVMYKYHVRFPRSGKYTVRFEQAMRQPELKGIMDIGLRVEKATN